MPWPDWRDETTYQFPSLSNRRAWAWEFLRRNTNYQSDFYNAKEIMETDELTHGPWPKRINQESHHRFEYRPRRYIGEKVEDWIRRTREQSVPDRLTPLQVVAERWLLSSAVDPETDDAPNFIGNQPLRIRSKEDLNRMMILDERDEPYLDPKYLIVAIDMSKPNTKRASNSLNRLMRDATTFYKGMADAESLITAKKAMPEWRNYLRVLDAPQQNPVLREWEICDELFPEDTHLDAQTKTDRIWTQRETAARLTRDYLQLLY